MNFTFLKKDAVAFFRSDAEQAEWTQEEMSLLCTFPYDKKKVIERGMTVLFQDPATKAYQAYEIRNCTLFPYDGYQQFTAEDIAISELTDCHIPEEIELTNITAKNALNTLLKNTGWKVGTDSSNSKASSGDIGRGSVWQGVCSVQNNWNVRILTRITVDASGITGKFLDIITAQGTWRGLRLAVNKNLDDPCVTYDDSELYTALYAYGASYSEGEGESRKTLERKITDVSWAKTADHPAKPKGQAFLEWPEKTALYGRNGKPRFGYYQNSSIDDPQVLLEKTWESLKQCADPKISITGTVTDLKRLGYADQPLRLYDLAIVELEPAGLQFYKQVIQLTVDLLDPSKNRPNIGDYIPNIIYINRQTDNDATGGGRGRGGGTHSKKQQGQFQTNIDQNERNINLNAIQINEQGEILRQAGMFIDPITGVLIYAEDTENNIGSKFHVQSNMISAEVEARKDGDLQMNSKIEQTASMIRSEVNNYVTNLQSEIKQEADRISMVVSSDGHINAAEIVASINNGQSSIKLAADHIDIDGLVSALEAESLTVGDLESNGSIEADQDVTAGGTVSGLVGSFDQVIVDEDQASWQEFTFTNITQWGNYHYFLYTGSQQGQTPTGSAYGRLPNTVQSKTIHYLGRS